MKIKTVIVDDEPLAREKIRTFLASDRDIRIVAECENGSKAAAAIRRHRPDLLFLDVQMPEMDGFGVLQTFSAAELPNVIFVTAYDRYAVRAFEVHALDYLLKPFDRARFRTALDRAKRQIWRDQSGEVSEKLVKLLEDLNERETTDGRSKYLQRLVIKSGGRVTFLKTDEIDWFEAAGNYVRLHVGKESHLLRETMNGMQASLDPEAFVRIHRSTIVKIDRIKEIQPWFNGAYLLRLENGQRLTSSRAYRHELSRLMQNTQ